jgi:hypothetical protein
MALLAYGASQGDKSGSSDVDGIGAQGDCFGYITTISDSACDDNRGLISDALLSEAVIHGSES